MICCRQLSALAPSEPFQLPQRLAPLPIGVGMDQVVEAFGPR